MVKKKRYGSSMGVFDWFRKPGPSVPQTPQPVKLPFQLPTNEDLYDVFGVAPNASEAQIRQSFKEQALKFHPDRNPDDPIAERRYREVSEAYRILTDPQMRAAYDVWRGTRPKAAAPPPRPPGPMYPMQVPQREEREGAAPTGPPVAQPPAAPARQPSPWEVMFGPVQEQGRAAPPEAFFTPFSSAPPPEQQRPGASFFRPPAPPPAPPAAPRPGQQMPGALARLDLPAVEDVAQLIYHTWPLDQIWQVARTERQRPAFAQSGVIHVDQVAGFRPGGLEYELGEDLGLPSWFIDQYLAYGRPGYEALWTQVFTPLFPLVSAAFEMLKPADLPGRFGLDVDQRGTRADLLYSEVAR